MWRPHGGRAATGGMRTRQLALLSLLALAMLVIEPSGWLVAASSRAGTPPGPPKCPSALTTTPAAGLLSLCATAANAVSVGHGTIAGKTGIATAGSAVATASLVTQTVQTESGKTRTTTDLDVGADTAPETAPEDRYAFADATGQVGILTYPANTLLGNFPGTGDYNPDLPVGVLYVPNGISAETTAASLTRVGARQFEPLQSSSGLTQISSVCDTASSDGTDANSNGEAWYHACFRTYKPTNGDSSNVYKWRQVFATGSGHGGFYLHRLDQTRNHTWLNNSGAMYDDWWPTGTTPYSACRSVSQNVGVSGAGFSASVSESWTVCPDSFGLQAFNPTGSPPKFQWGWNGRKHCGSGPFDRPANCSYIGNFGGFSARIGEGQTFSAHTSVGIRAA
jgi:hypothetical protein